jgi:beta-lactamase class A
MYEVFRLRQAGVLGFDDLLTIGPGDAAEDLGTLIWPIGTRITVGTALERMITISDNSSAVMLTRTVGARGINETMVRIGLEKTSIQRDSLSTSPLDMLRLLEQLARGEAIDRTASAEMVSLMTRQLVRDRIPALLPAEATVGNKTGNWEAAVHDVGLIYGPHTTLVVALLSDDVSDHEEATLAMARAARALYEVAEDPAFGSRQEPALQLATQGSYAAAPLLPPPPPTRAPAPPRVVRPESIPTARPVESRQATEPTAVPTASSAEATPKPTTAPKPSEPRPTRTPRPEPTREKQDSKEEKQKQEREKEKQEPTPTAKPRQ